MTQLNFVEVGRALTVISRLVGVGCVDDPFAVVCSAMDQAFDRWDVVG